MPRLSTPQFLELLRVSKLLEPEQMAELDADSEVPRLAAKTLASRLVKRGWLTEWQVYQLVQGNGKDLVVGAYRLLDRLGEGGMGYVYKAYHQPMQRVVALKVIREEKLAHPHAVPRFKREWRAAGQLFHPNIVLAFDAGQFENRLFFAMEYVDGLDLARLVDRVGPLPAVQACDYIRQAAIGLQHAYERGMVHRDIKPSNLIVTGAGGREPEARGQKLDGKNQDLVVPVVKILDMGLVRLDDTEELPADLAGEVNPDPVITQQGKVMGTAAFLAPEQATNSHAVDIRADLYSLGCTFYFLLAGDEPFKGETPFNIVVQHRKSEPPDLQKLRPDVPPGVIAIVRKLMAKKPDDRYQTPAELAAVLGPFCEDPNNPAHLIAREKLKRSTQEGDWGLEEPEDSKTAPLAGKRRLPPWYYLAGVGVALLVVVGGLLLVAPRWLKTTEATNKMVEQPPPTRPEPKEKPSVGPAPGKQPEKLARDPLPLPAWGTPGKVQSFDEFRGPIAVSPEGRYVLSLDRSQQLCLWELATGKVVRWFQGLSGAASCLAVSPDGRWAAAAGRDFKIRVWDVDSGRVVTTFDKHEAEVKALAFFPDNRRLVSAGGTIPPDGKPKDTDLPIWNLDNGQPIGQLVGHNAQVVCVAVSPDGKLVLSGSWDHTLRLWDATTGKQRKQFGVNGQGPIVTCVAFHPHEPEFFTGDRTKTLARYKWDTDQGIEHFRGHTREVSCLAVSPDGSRLLSGSFDGTVRLWNTSSDQELKSFHGEHKDVGNVAFTSGGRRALSAGPNQGVIWWRLPEP
jgi:serine/threonine-protein kinase